MNYNISIKIHFAGGRFEIIVFVAASCRNRP